MTAQAGSRLPLSPAVDRTVRRADDRAERPRISLVIPTVTGSVAALVESLRTQTVIPDEIEVVRGVRPNGRARNRGVGRTNGEVVVFVDDDAWPGNARVIERLVASLLADPTIGATGSARLIPPGSTRFQRRVAREVARIEHPVVRADLETNPEAANRFYCEITTTCCAMRRSVFTQVGGFDEELVQGVDTEFFVRLRRAGYRLVLVADTWVYHPAPATLRLLLGKHVRYGMGHAQEVGRDPVRARGPERWPLAYLLLRTAGVLPHVVLPFSYASPKWRPGFRPLKALASFAAACGYVWGCARAGMALSVRRRGAAPPGGRR